MHCNKRHALAGVNFDLNMIPYKILLYNQGIVRTPGATESSSSPIIRTLMKILLRILGQPKDNAIKPIIDILNKKSNKY